MEVSVALTAVIAVCAVLSALGLIFRVLLNPVYKEIGYLHSDVAELKNDVTELKNGQIALENGQKEFNKKLDQLINRLSDKGVI